MASLEPDRDHAAPPPGGGAVTCEGPDRPLPGGAWSDRAGVLVLLLAAAAFLPGLAAGFVWDDVPLIVENTLTDELADLPRLWSTDLWAGAEVASPDSGFYRPLVTTSFLVDRLLLGLSAPLAHLHSLAWHLLACALWWALLRRLVPPAAAVVGLAVFALHPAQVEAVTWVAARNDPMAAALLFGALLSLRRGTARGAVVALVCALGAALSKETALLLPVIMAALWLAAERRLSPWRAWAAVGAALGAYAALRGLAGVALPARADAAHVEAAAGPALAFLARTALWPVDLAPGLHLAWPPPVPWHALALAALLGLGLLLAGRGLALAGVVLAALTLAPALGAVASQGLVADRYLYLPLAGLGLAAAAAARRLPPRLALGLGVALALGGAVGTSAQVPTWRDDLTLWRAALERHPSRWVEGVLARELELAGELDEAALYYRRAVAPPAPMQEACYRITAVHLPRGAFQQALEDGAYAREAGCPDSPELLAPMALARAALGDWDGAEVAAMEARPDPTGLSTVVAVAAGARRGDLGPMRVAIAAHPEADPAGLYRQVAWLLEQAGEGEAAARVRAAGGL